MNLNELEQTKPLWLQVVSITSTSLLFAATLISSLLLLGRWIHAKQKGAIKLTSETPKATTRKALFSALLLSHIDSSLDEGGIPIDVEGFWKRVSPCQSLWRVSLIPMAQQVRLPKLILLFVTSISFGFQIYRTVRSHEDGQGKGPIICLVGETVTCVFTLVAAICCYLTTQITLHKSLIHHLCALSSILFLYWYLATFGQYLSIQYLAHPHWSEYCALGLSLFQTVVSGTIPVGPGLWIDRSKIYNKALTTAFREADSKSGPNIDPGVSVSIISQLLFTFVFPMISKASSMEQIDIQDLPAGTAEFRIQHNLHSSIKTYDRMSVASRFGPTVDLLWTIWSPQWRQLLTCE